MKLIHFLLIFNINAIFFRTIVIYLLNKTVKKKMVKENAQSVRGHLDFWWRWYEDEVEDDGRRGRINEKKIVVDGIP